MSCPTFPPVLHPRYTQDWRSGHILKSAMPQQYLYSESETMSTDDDRAGFVHYRKYKYGRSHQLSMNSLQEMGKAEVQNKPSLDN